MIINVKELYETQLSRLDSAEQLQLLALLANGLNASFVPPVKATHSLLELEGLGAEVWQGPNGQPLDAQQYVNQLREEWEQRP
jgi:hypothetical protein